MLLVRALKLANEKLSASPGRVICRTELEDASRAFGFDWDDTNNTMWFSSTMAILCYFYGVPEHETRAAGWVEAPPSACARAAVLGVHDALAYAVLNKHNTLAASHKSDISKLSQMFILSLASGLRCGQPLARFAPPLYIDVYDALRQQKQMSPCVWTGRPLVNVIYDDDNHHVEPQAARACAAAHMFACELIKYACSPAQRRIARRALFCGPRDGAKGPVLVERIAAFAQMGRAPARWRGWEVSIVHRIQREGATRGDQWQIVARLAHPLEQDKSELRQLWTEAFEAGAVRTMQFLAHRFGLTCLGEMLRCGVLMRSWFFASAPNLERVGRGALFVAACFATRDSPFRAPHCATQLYHAPLARHLGRALGV